MKVGGALKQLAFVPSTQISEYSMRGTTALSDSRIEDFKIGKLLGKGAYAEVKECIHLKTGLSYALKIYEKVRLLDPLKKRNMIREIHVLEELNHCNIIHLYHVLETPKLVMLVIELVKGKSLKTMMRESSRGLKESKCIKIFKQILSAVEYMHSRGIAHRDLKLDNILIDEINNAKIIDFGFSVCCKYDLRLKMFCGTPSYMCPEIIHRKDYLGPPADMWSLGIILYTMISGNLPFKSMCFIQAA